MKPNIVALLSTCMEVPTSLLCLFVHEPLYQTVVVCCNSVFATFLQAWITVAFSMLEWGSLRLAPIKTCCQACTAKQYVYKGLLLCFR